MSRTASDALAGLLEDLQNITDVAQAGIISKGEASLRPGETRPAAIVYIDVVGFTDLARVLSPERLADLIDKTFRIYELTVKGHGGYCDSVIGDAALYVFPGHPNYPPACEAALRCAVMLLERTRQISESLRTTGQTLSIRVGVSFGEVARQVVGGDEQRLTVMGDTVNIAQRLESCADPGTIHSTWKVLDRAGELTLAENRGTMALKGFGEVTVHQVWSFKPRPVKLRGSFRRLTPLIGRDEQLRETADTLSRWLAIRYDPSTLDIATSVEPIVGRNRLLIIKGDAAFGKSRLAYEVVETIRHERQICTSTCHFTSHSSASGVATEIAAVCGINAENLPERWDELCNIAAARVSLSYAERMRGHLALLAYILDCEFVDTSAMRKNLDPGSFLVNIKLAIRACCELAAFEQDSPVVLIFEDLQWIGELREIADDLIRFACLPHPLVVIGTARPDYVHRAGQLGEGELAEIELARLDSQQGRAMMAALLPGLEMPAAVEKELHDKAYGLPYFYEEFARLLIRRELVTEQDGQFSTKRELGDLAIPDDIRMLILGRLDQLEPELRALTGRASVLGRSFYKGLLAKLESKLGLIPSDELDRELAQLTMHQVLGQEPGDRYFFEHVLTRDAAYGALLKTNRAVLHTYAREVLEEVLVPGTAAEWELLPELVRHLEAIEEYERAHERCCDFLALMAHTGNYDHWAVWEQRARGNWQNARRLDPLKPEISASLLAVLGWQHYCTGRLTEALECYESALELARRAHDRVREREVLNFLGTLNRNQGRNAEGQRCYEDALQIMRITGDQLGEGTVLRNLGILHQNKGSMEEARWCFEQSLLLKKQVGDKRGEGISLNNLGTLHRQQGRLEEARRCYQQSLDIKRETGDRRGEAITLTNMGNLHGALGQIAEAQRCYEQALVINREIGDRRREGITLHHLGVLMQQQDRMSDAQAMYEQSLRISRELKDRDSEGNTLTQLGLWHSAQGEIAEAESLHLEALEIGRGIGLRNLEAAVQSQLGDIYRRQGRFEEARAALEAATQMLSALSDSLGLGLSHCNWAWYHLDCGEPSLARLDVARAEAASAMVGAGSRFELGAQSELGRAIAKVRQAVRENEEQARQADAP